MVQGVVSAGRPSARGIPGRMPAVGREAVRSWAAGRGRTVVWAVVGVGFAAGAGLLLSNGEAAATVSGAADVLAEVHWAVVPALAVLVFVHFWFSAVALRGVAGRRLPLLHATMAQFTGATANRITGGGVGTVAVNARYLSGQGVPASRALALAGVLQVGGALADLLLFAAMVPIAMTAGDGLLLPHLGEQLRGMARPVLIIAAVVVVPAVAAAWFLRDRLSGPVAAGALLLRRPRDLAVMLVASAATTLVMGVAFALSVLAIPGAVSWDRFGVLIVVYMVGAAAGGVIPGPGGLGSTEAALVALLAATGMETTSAVSGVLIFRAVTHWAPVPIGLLTAATVRNRGKAASAPGDRPEAQHGHDGPCGEHGRVAAPHAERGHGGGREAALSGG